MTEHGHGINSKEERDEALQSRFRRDRKEAIDGTILELEDLDKDFVQKSLHGEMYRSNSDAEQTEGEREIAEV